MSGKPNVVYVGRKPPMSYVMAVITSFTGSDTKDVTLKARGQSITTAVDTADNPTQVHERIETRRDNDRN